MHKINDKIKSSSFLITGGAGFIGSNIVKYLFANGAKYVKVLDDLSNGSLSNLKPYIDKNNFEFINGDIRDFSTCINAVDGIDYVSHQAALGSVPRSIKDPILSNDVNISGFLNMLRASSKNKNVVRFVYAASSSTYGDSEDLPKIEGKEGNPMSPYAITKYVNELYADIFYQVYGFKSIGLRYFNVFGPHQSPNNPYAAVIPLFMNSAYNNKRPYINGDGSYSRDFTYVDNAVQANILAMLNSSEIKKHEVINIAVNRRTSILQLWNSIAKISKTNVKPIFREIREGDVPHSLASIDKAKNLINYNPEIFLDEGLVKTYEWFVSNYNKIY